MIRMEGRQMETEVLLHEQAEDSLLKFAVVMARKTNY